MQPLPAPDETLDRLAGEWWIFQLRAGHRYSTDDVLTAWAAGEALPAPRHILDLGAGVGAVGLMALLRAPSSTRLTALEVQPVSAALLRKTVAWNGLDGRAEVVLGDLREALPRQAGFDLVVANPPYLPPGSALRSPYPQRAAARLELHGDVFDYCRAAAGHLDEDGRFCFCYPAHDPRAGEAIRSADLSLVTRRLVIFREGRPPALALFTCGRSGEARELPALRVRTTSGERSPEYHEVRRAMLIDE